VIGNGDCHTQLSGQKLTWVWWT